MRLTKEREALIRNMAKDAGSTFWSCFAPEIIAELDATRAELADVTERAEKAERELAGLRRVAEAAKRAIQVSEYAMAATKDDANSALAEANASGMLSINPVPRHRYLSIWSNGSQQIVNVIHDALDEPLAAIDQH